MKKPPSKSRVLSMGGEYQPEVVTQRQLQELSRAQAVEWSASKHAAVLAEKIRLAIARGATVEDGELQFDNKLEMVRSRKAASGA